LTIGYAEVSGSGVVIKAAEGQAIDQEAGARVSLR
jgi:hypothetical protein